MFLSFRNFSRDVLKFFEVFYVCFWNGMTQDTYYYKIHIFAKYDILYGTEVGNMKHKTLVTIKKVMSRN